MLVAADNTGAKKLQCILVQGRSTRKRSARIGDTITCVVKEALAHSAVKKSDIVQAVVVRTRKEYRRPDGTYIRFDDNAAVLVDPNTKEPKGSRIFGPVARELRAKGFTKIISLAPEVL